MLTQIKGLHHVTSMAADAQQNNDFFTKVLGLRRVKKTVNFDEPSRSTCARPICIRLRPSRCRSSLTYDGGRGERSYVAPTSPDEHCMVSGIHHVTAITRNVQANVNFYVGFLGMRLVKQTGGCEDGEQLHLFCGDRLGSPGSILTFLVWQDGAPGRTGPGQVSEIAFAVPPLSLGEWLHRAINAGVRSNGPKREFGEPTLRLRDPDGITVKLVGVDMATAAPLADPLAPNRIRSVTILTADASATASFAARFGYREAKHEAR